MKRFFSFISSWEFLLWLAFREPYRGGQNKHHVAVEWRQSFVRLSLITIKFCLLCCLLKRLSFCYFARHFTARRKKIIESNKNVSLIWIFISFHALNISWFFPVDNFMTQRSGSRTGLTSLLWLNVRSYRAFPSPFEDLQQKSIVSGHLNFRVSHYRDQHCGMNAQWSITWAERQS